MQKARLFLLIIIPLTLLVFLFPQPACAQEFDGCTSLSSFNEDLGGLYKTGGAPAYPVLSSYSGENTAAVVGTSGAWVYYAIELDSMTDGNFIMYTQASLPGRVKYRYSCTNPNTNVNDGFNQVTGADWGAFTSPAWSSTCSGAARFINLAVYNSTVVHLNYLQVTKQGCTPPTPTPTPTATPTPTDTCPLVPNYQFSTSNDWLLAGGATITNSTLVLPLDAQAAQNIGPGSNKTYNLAISVTEVISAPNSLSIVLGIDTQIVNVITPGLYIAPFTTGNLGGPIALGIENNGPGQVTIDYLCLSLDTAIPAQVNCIGPPNGDFTTSGDWNYSNNAAYNGATKAAFLPYNDPTQSGPYYTPAFIETSAFFTLPTITIDEFLIMQFSAQSVNGQNALLTSLTGNQAQTIDQEFIFEVYPQSYEFQADVSLLAGESTALLFGNDGNYPDDPAYNENVNLDNVCIFISDSGPTLPTPTDPNSINPVNLGQFYSCGDVAGFMVNWGVDMRYHQANYLDTPGVWDAADWVPWLISAGFVGMEIYLCAFVVFLQSVLNIVEYAINNGLNWGHWLRNNGILGIPWALNYFYAGYFSFENFAEFLRGTADLWLFWLQLSLEAFGTVPGQLVDNLATLALWGALGFSWLAGIYAPLLLWFLPEANNMVRGILNLLIENGWNGFMAGLSAALSEILDTLVFIWNNGLFPMFAALIPGLGLFWFFSAFWGLLWGVVLYLWANVFSTINIPFAFYIGLNEGINSPAFSNLAGCDGTTGNFWCGVFAALDLLNIVAGASIFYPIVIVGITIGTMVILYRNMLALWEFYADWLSRI